MVPTAKWALLDIYFWFEDDDLWISAGTDSACHLFCRYTLLEPERKLEPLYKRGIYLKETLRSCFVEYQTVEQQQAGDTTAHLFLIPNWTVCQTCWLYLIGYIAAVESPSESPDFKKHYPGWFCTFDSLEEWTWRGDKQPPWCLEFLEDWSS